MNRLYHIIDAMWKLAAGLAVLSVVSAASCTSSLLEDGGWEGIRGATLRVYVTLDIPEDIGQGAVTGRMKELLLAAGKKRAMMLLEASIRENISDPVRADACQVAIDAIVNTGKMIFFECGEYSCAAFIDFTAIECIDAGHGTPGGTSK